MCKDEKIDGIHITYLFSFFYLLMKEWNGCVDLHESDCYFHDCITKVMG